MRFGDNKIAMLLFTRCSITIHMCNYGKPNRLFGDIV